CLCRVAWQPARGRRSLPGTRGFPQLRGLPKACRRRVPRSLPLGKDGHPQHGAGWKILKRPNHSRVRPRYLESQATARLMNSLRVVLTGFVLGAAAVMFGAAATAPTISPAIVYDMGGKFDRSFNQSASDGVEKFKKDTGIAVREFEISNAAQREQ